MQEVYVAHPPHDWAYVLVTPDGVISGALDQVVTCLGEHGLRPSACRLVDLSVEAMQQVYLESSWHISNPGYADVTFSYAMHGEMYKLAPACLIMLSRSSAPVCEAMIRCKGNTRPEIAGAGTIRWAAENVIFNLVHSPDDTVSASRELKVLVGWDTVAQLLAATRSGDSKLLGLVGVESMAGCVPAFTGWQAISFVAIANKVRRRIVQYLSLALQHDEEALDILVGTQRKLVAEQEEFIEAPTSGARLHIARRANVAIRVGLADAARRHGDEIVIKGVEALEELYHLDGARRLEDLLALSGRGLPLSPLEKIILESHSYSFRPSRELLEIYPYDVPAVSL